MGYLGTNVVKDSASSKARLADLYRHILIVKTSDDLCGCHPDANGGLSQILRILTSSRHGPEANRASISGCGAQFIWHGELFWKHRFGIWVNGARVPSLGYRECGVVVENVGSIQEDRDEFGSVLAWHGGERSIVGPNKVRCIEWSAGNNELVGVLIRLLIGQKQWLA